MVLCKRLLKSKQMKKLLHLWCMTLGKASKLYKTLTLHDRWTESFHCRHKVSVANLRTLCHKEFGYLRRKNKFEYFAVKELVQGFSVIDDVHLIKASTARSLQLHYKMLSGRTSATVRGAPCSTKRAKCRLTHAHANISGTIKLLLLLIGHWFIPADGSRGSWSWY